MAHVDSGKTTFAEQLLYCAGAIREPGRVDQKNTVMDADPVEKARGITVFADQGHFTYNGNEYFLVDTPGHVDFSAETQRSLVVLDYAILLLDASGKIPAHALTLFRLLKRANVPTFLFLNKMDLEGASRERAMAAIRERLTPDAVFLGEDPPNLDFEGDLGEFLADRDEELFEEYLAGTIDAERAESLLKTWIRERKAFPVCCGSALSGEHIAGFLELFDRLTDTAYNPNAPFRGVVYKVRHDAKGRRLTFVKALAGTLRPKSAFRFEGEDEAEKVNEIFDAFGARLSTKEEIAAGELAAVTGLVSPGWGQELVLDATCKQNEQRLWLIPALEAQVCALDGTDNHRLLHIFQILEDEDEELAVRSVRLSDGTEQICVRVMGVIQLEILVSLVRERFGVSVEFPPPRVLYQETIAAPQPAYGHYEPLRHYAEVNLRLEPGERGSGITFESECSLEHLAINYQNLVKTHVFEREHRGVLVGAPLTDVKVVLTDGRAHLKHTEGGDFREATWRAIRQGLMGAKSVLLEPFCSFEITAPMEYVGRILSQLDAKSARTLPPEHIGELVVIAGRGPVSSLMDYAAQLAAATRGAGSIAMTPDGYDLCHNAQEVIAAASYDPGADKEQPAYSVFCSHGAGFAVSWDEAEVYMHCLKR